MNTCNEYTERTRFSKNKSKTRYHEKRAMCDRDVTRYMNTKSKKMQQSIKNFKRMNNVERNPIIVNARGSFHTIEDYEAWYLHVSGRFEL